MKILLSLTLLLSLGAFSTATVADQYSNRDDNGQRRGYSNRDFDNRNHDNRSYDNRDRRSSGYRRDRDTDVSVNVIVGPGSRYYPGFNRGFNRGINNFYNNNYYNSGYNSIFNTFGYGVGYSTFGGQVYLNYGYPYTPWSYRNNRPVVIEQNTYISQPVERSGVTTYSNRRSGTSLLRDLQGRCFERVIDRYGNETRTELDPSACDF